MSEKIEKRYPTPEERKAHRCWNFPPMPEAAHKEKFSKRTLAYTVLTVGDYDATVFDYLKGVGTKLAELEFVFRFSGKKFDLIGQDLYKFLPDNAKETYKNFAKDGVVIGEGVYLGDDTATMMNTNYEGHSVAADAFDKYCEARKLTLPSTLEEDVEKITNDPTLSAIDKGEKVRELTVAHNKNKGTLNSFDKLGPSPRSSKAHQTHLIMGEKCTAPVKFLLISSPMGTTDWKSFKKDVKDDTKMIGFQIFLAGLYDIPVFNIGVRDGQEKFNKFMETL